ncbi:MAG: PQQ-binding-like beta-propeller repeat protein, partial [Chloroflexi bacterium]|nr:PQQ-binding-like beta-propeller repeat protein [Chloroflexota bacterium]
DIYSLGTLAYELLTGGVPFDALSPYTILSRQLISIPTLPSRIEETLPAAVDDVVLKALNRRADLRYATCGEMVKALEQAAGLLGASAPAYAAAASLLAAPTADYEVAAAPLPTQEERVICPHCGTGNSATAQRCQNCWGLLAGQPTVSVEEETQFTRRYLARLRRQSRRVKLTFLGGIVLLLAFWAYNLIEIRPPLPHPTTNLTSVSQEGEWVTAGRDALHTSAVPGPAFAPRGETVWQFTSEGPILAAPAVDADRVYVATSDGRVAALDKATGEAVWTFPVNGPVNSAPSLAGDLLFFGLRDGSIFALDARTGKEQWSYQTGSAIYASLLVVDGALYAGSTDRRLYALDAQTGELRWKREVENWIVAPPAVVDGIVAFGAQDGEIYMIDASNGTLRNQLRLGSAIDSPPVIVGDTAYFATRTGRIIAFRYQQKDIPFQKAFWWGWFQLWAWNMASPPPPTPGLVWFVDIKKLVIGDMATDGRRLYAPDAEGSLRALDLGTGKALWTLKNLGKLTSTPIVSGETLIQVVADGTVLGLDAATGVEQWRYAIGEGVVASPVLAGGTFYVPTAEGSLFAMR